MTMTAHYIAVLRRATDLDERDKIICAAVWYAEHVYGLSGISHDVAECLCGALARPEELQEIAFWYPEVGQRIHALEKQCFVLGLPLNWGSKQTPIPPKE